MNKLQCKRWSYLFDIIDRIDDECQKRNLSIENINLKTNQIQDYVNIKYREYELRTNAVLSQKLLGEILKSK